MAFDAFLKLDQIKGGTTDDKHKDEIDILSFSWGVSRPAGSGARPAFEDFHFSMRPSPASPLMSAKGASGDHIKTAALTLRRGGGDLFEFLKYTLTDVVVTSYGMKGDKEESGVASSEPLENLSISYAKIEWSYSPKSGTAYVKGGWNLSTNKPV